MTKRYKPEFGIVITPTEGAPGRVVTDYGFPQPASLDVRFQGNVKKALFAYMEVLLTVPHLLMDACADDPEKEAAWRDFLELFWQHVDFRKVKAIQHRRPARPPVPKAPDRVHRILAGQLKVQ